MDGDRILPDKAIAAEFWQQFSPDDPVIWPRFVRRPQSLRAGRYGRRSMARRAHIPGAGI